MESQEKLQLKVKSSYYVQNFKQSVNIDAFEINMMTGSIEMKGYDEVGSFIFKGKLEGDYFNLIKSYIGQHQIFYAGVLVKNSINMNYGFMENPQTLAEHAKSGNFNSAIELDSQNFIVSLPDDNTKNVLLEKDNQGNMKGFFIENGQFKFINAMKISGTCYLLSLGTEKGQQVYEMSLEGGTFSFNSED